MQKNRKPLFFKDFYQPKHTTDRPKVPFAYIVSLLLCVVFLYTSFPESAAAQQSGRVGVIDFLARGVRTEVAVEARDVLVNTLSALGDFTFVSEDEMRGALGDDYVEKIYNCNYDNVCLYKYGIQLRLDILFVASITGVTGNWVFSSKMLILGKAPASCFVVKPSPDRADIFMMMVRSATKKLLDCATTKFAGIMLEIARRGPVIPGEFIKGELPRKVPIIIDLNEADLLFARGLRAFFDGEYRPAKGRFMEVTRMLPENDTSVYYTGLSSFMLRDYAQAAFELENVMSMEGETIDDARFYAAVSHYRNKEYSKARGLFLENVEKTHDEEMRCASMLYLQMIRYTLGDIIAEGKRSYVHVGLGVQLDDNVALEPKISIDPEHLPKKITGTRLVILSHGALSKKSKAFGFGGGYDLYQSYHIMGEEGKNDYDTSRVGPSGFLEYMPRILGIPVRMRLSAEVGYSLLGFEAYCLSYSAFPSIGFPIFKDVDVSIVYRFKKEDFLTDDYKPLSNLNNSIKMIWNFLVGGDKVRLKTTLEYEIFNAKEGIKDFNGINISSSIYSIIILKLRGEAGALYFTRTFPNDSEPAQDRRDKGIDVLLNLFYPLWKNMELSVGYVYSMNSSWNTEDKYTWERGIASSFISYGF